jgi:hypothetical protein
VITDQLIEKADTVRGNHEAAQARIAGRLDLNAEAKRSLGAREYLAAKEAMQTLQSAAQGDDGTRRSKVAGQVFGIEGIGGDRVNAATSLRDAQDRAAQLDDPDDASRVLTLATDSGDELTQQSASTCRQNDLNGATSCRGLNAAPEIASASQ